MICKVSILNEVMGNNRTLRVSFFAVPRELNVGVIRYVYIQLGH